MPMGIVSWVSARRCLYVATRGRQLAWLPASAATRGFPVAWLPVSVRRCQYALDPPAPLYCFGLASLQFNLSNRCLEPRSHFGSSFKLPENVIRHGMIPVASVALKFLLLETPWTATAGQLFMEARTREL